MLQDLCAPPMRLEHERLQELSSDFDENIVMLSARTRSVSTRSRRGLIFLGAISRSSRHGFEGLSQDFEELGCGALGRAVGKVEDYNNQRSPTTKRGELDTVNASF